MMKCKLKLGPLILILLFSILNLIPKVGTTNSSVELPQNGKSGSGGEIDSSIGSISKSTTLSKDDKKSQQKTADSPENLKGGKGDDRQGSKSKAKKPKRKRKPKKIKLNKDKMPMGRSRSLLTGVGNDDESKDSIDLAAVADLSRTYKLRFGGESFDFEVEYLDETEINSPILKHYTLYNSDFYPPYSYHGFFPPSQWHEVPIEYFTRSSRGTVGPKDMKRHRSAMHICSPKAAKDSEKCYEMMENECMNIMPSPIDIITAEAAEDDSPDTFEFLHFETFFGFKMFIPEDGTDLLYLTFLSPKKLGKIPTVSGGSVGNHDLFLDRILFHFGTSYLKGSEHTIDGKHYGMEIQLYFTGDQGTYWESLAKYKFMKPNDPLLGHNVHVFSIMVSVADPRATTPGDENAKFASRFEVLSLAATMFWEKDNSQKHRAVQVTQKLISLEDFLGAPSSYGSYYTYDGSLTHPPCLKHAKWTVFKNPIWITYDQWIKFATIRSEFSDLTILENIRPMTSIYMKVDIPNYLDMREAEGLPPLTQNELDTEVQYRHRNGSKKELYVIKKYTDFRHYFAKGVKKVNPVQRREHSSDDYYDTKPSGSSPVHLTLFYFCLIVPQTLLYNTQLYTYMLQF